MIKAIRLVARPDGLAAEEFKWRWLLRHGSVAREAVAQSEIHKITASFATDEQITEYGEGHQVPVAQDFDALEAIYFPTYVHLQSALGAGVLGALDASLDTIAPGASRVPRVITLEEVMARHPGADALLGGPPRTKLLRTLKKKEDLDLVQFRDYWHNHHKVIESGGAFRGWHALINVSFSQGKTIASGEIRDIAASDGLMDLDGIIEVFSTPLADHELRASYRQPFVATTRRDELNFLSMDAPIRRVFMAEHVAAAT